MSAGRGRAPTDSAPGPCPTLRVRAAFVAREQLQRACDRDYRRPGGARWQFGTCPTRGRAQGRKVLRANCKQPPRRIPVDGGPRHSGERPCACTALAAARKLFCDAFSRPLVRFAGEYLRSLERRRQPPPRARAGGASSGLVRLRRTEIEPPEVPQEHARARGGPRARRKVDDPGNSSLLWIHSPRLLRG